MKPSIPSTPARPPLRAIRAIMLATCALLLSACSILPKNEPVDVFTLPATRLGPAPAGASAVSQSLRIRVPASDVQLGSRQIAVVPANNQLNVYKGARWSASTPVLLRNRLLDAFTADGRVAALTSDENSVQVDYELHSHLRDFQTEYVDGAPTAIIRADVVLAMSATDLIVATRRFEARQPVNGSGVPEVVQAFGTASDAIAREILGWTLVHMPQPPRGNEPGPSPQ